MPRLPAGALAVLALLTGCTFTTRLNRSHFVAPPVPEDQRLEGRVLVLTAPADDAFVYSGHPSSFTGGATTLVLPLGEITREAAVRAFGDLFRGGADRSNGMAGLEGYRAVIVPHALSFDYQYNALSNLGFAITPEAKVSVSVTLLDQGGSPVWQRTYESGTHSGDTYFVSFSPGDRIAKAAHEAVFELMRRAAADIKAVLAVQAQAGPQPAPGTVNPPPVAAGSSAPPLPAAVPAGEGPTASPVIPAPLAAPNPAASASGQPAQYPPRPQDYPALPPQSPLSSPLPGQRPPSTRDSWYIGFGLGGGAGRIKYGGRTLSFSEFLGGGADTIALNARVGATITPKLLLGADVGAIGAVTENDLVQLNYYDIGMMFFPMQKGLFLRGAAGLSVLTIDASSSPYVTGTGTLRGENVLLGLGYAFWIGRSFNLTVNVDYQAHFLNAKIPSLYGGEDVSLDSGSGVSGWVGFDWY